MRYYSFSSAALYPRDSIDSLKLIGDAGFKFAELMPQCFSDLSEKFALKAQKTGVQIASIHYPLTMFSMLYNCHPGMVAETRDLNSNLTRIAKELGTEIIVIHPHNYANENYAGLLEKPIVENIVNLADLCLENGIILAVENSPKSPGATPEGLLEYVKQFSHKAILPMVDTTEAFEAGIKPEVFIEKVNPAHLHMSDHKGAAKHVPAGKGEMDWGAINEVLKDFKGFLTLEPSYRYYIDDAEQGLYDARLFLEDIFV